MAYFYIQSLVNIDLYFNNKGQKYLIKANLINKIDDSYTTISEVQGTFGQNIMYIPSPTELQIASAYSSLQESTTINIGDIADDVNSISNNVVEVHINDVDISDGVKSALGDDNATVGDGSLRGDLKDISNEAVNTNIKLDNIESNTDYLTALKASTFYNGITTVATAGTPVQITTTPTLLKVGRISIKNPTTNTGVTIYFGNSSNNAKSGYGYPLVPGDEKEIFIDDLSKVWIDAGSNATSIKYIAY